MRDHTDLTEQMLDSKIQQIDLRDGASDGRIAITPLDCPSCGAKSNSKRKICIMCGAPLVKRHTFEG